MIYPIISIKLIDSSGQLVYKGRSNKTNRILFFARRENWDLAQLKVIYKSGLTNEGTYKDYESLRFAIGQFTEGGIE